MNPRRRDPADRGPPGPIPPMARFRCRRCGRALTPALRLVTDLLVLSDRPGTSLVPAGMFWPVAMIPPGPTRRMHVAEDFAGRFAVALADLVDVLPHPDPRRLIGCCGPNGTAGPNRVCACGREVGTERSDCLGSRAAYLDPALVRMVAPGPGPVPG